MSNTRENLEQLAGVQEVVIEAGSDGARFEALIWVVEHDGDLYVRSYRGEAGLWYQAAQANPVVTLRAGERSQTFRAIPARDDDSIEGVSTAIRTKYSHMGPWMEAMVVPEVLGTTLRLDPIE